MLGGEMKKTKISITQILTGQFEALIKSIKEIKSTAEYMNTVRYRPLFSSYNSHIETFIQKFPNEYKLLNLEPLPLLDKNGNDAFTANKLSTLLHQSEFIFALLKSIQPKEKSRSIRESLSWYWNNTHWSIILFLGSIFIAGVISSETTLYKNAIKPFIIEYIAFKNIQQEIITNNEPPKQNRIKK